MSVQTERTADDSDSKSSTETSDADASISKDDAFHILQNSRRRAVLRYLAAHDDERFVMRDLAEEVAAWEHDTTVQQLVSDERQRVYIALYQSHLPKLDDHDVIEYNQSRGVVEPTELVDALASYLDEGLHSDADLTVEAESESTEAQGESITETVSALFSR